MAKKGAVQIQIEVENEADWEALVDRPGLIVVDVYSDWCGPCSGMMGTLRKIKLEIGGDILTLAAAKCDEIQCLERFRNKSEPTWMFISNRKMIRLMFGADAPQLMYAMMDEIRKENQGAYRDGIEFDQLTDEEQERVDEETRIREEQEEFERSERERAINERREAILDNLMEPMKDFNYVFVSRHVRHDGFTHIADELKMTGMSSVGKTVRHHFTDQQLDEMSYYSTWVLSDAERDVLLKDEISGMLFQAPAGEFDPVIDVFLLKVYGESQCPPGDENSLAMKHSTTIKIPKEKFEDAENSEEPKISNDEEVEDDFIEVIIPGVYAPENEQCKILGMRVLFPGVTGKFDLPEPEPIPPHLIVAFEVMKRDEVMEFMEQYPEETMAYGFFTSFVADEAKLVAKTRDQFEKTPGRPVDTKLIIKVSKKKSEPLLSYSLLGPCYVSPNVTVGEKECAILFPEGYEEAEPEMESEELEARKSKQPGYSVDELGPEELEEEELEEEEEEEEDLDFMEEYEESTDVIE